MQRRAGCCSLGLIPRATAACSPVSATSVKSSCWEAGFTPLEAIHIATANGEEFLGESARIGTIAGGKQADLVVIHSDPSSKEIGDIRKVEIVFKDGVGYDSAKLIESVKGRWEFGKPRNPAAKADLRSAAWRG